MTGRRARGAATPKKLHVMPRACSTCPYRRDTPPGLWHPEEYEKLPRYDEGAANMALSVFHCHQENATGVDTVCRGWLGTHRDSIPVRLAQMSGKLDPADVPREAEPYLYASGAEACAAGLAGVAKPSREAQAEMRKLLRRGAGRPDPEDVVMNAKRMGSKGKTVSPKAAERTRARAKKAAEAAAPALYDPKNDPRGARRADDYIAKNADGFGDGFEVVGVHPFPAPTAPTHPATTKVDTFESLTAEIMERAERIPCSKREYADGMLGMREEIEMRYQAARECAEDERDDEPPAGHDSAGRPITDEPEDE